MGGFSPASLQGGTRGVAVAEGGDWVPLAEGIGSGLGTSKEVFKGLSSWR